MNNSPEVMKRIGELDCEYRFAHVGPTYIMHEASQKPIIDPNPKKKPGTYCYIVDKPTGETYATGYAIGADEAAALEDAIAKAVTAPKPLTPSQKVHQQHVTDVVAEKDTTIAELNRQIEELKRAMPSQNDRGSKATK